MMLPTMTGEKNTDNYSELWHNLPKLLIAICPHRRIILFQYHRIESSLLNFFKTMEKWLPFCSHI